LPKAPIRISDLKIAFFAVVKINWFSEKEIFSTES
jgi:hypothetical protein